MKNHLILSIQKNKIKSNILLIYSLKIVRLRINVFTIFEVIFIWLIIDSNVAPRTPSFITFTLKNKQNSMLKLTK